MTIIPETSPLDQTTVLFLIEHDGLCQRVRALFDLLDWCVVPDPAPDPHRRGPRPHPARAYLQALLLKLGEQLVHCTTLRRYLLEHPLFMLIR